MGSGYCTIVGRVLRLLPLSDMSELVKEALPELSASLLAKEVDLDMICFQWYDSAMCR